MDQNIGVVDFVFTQDVLHDFFIEVCECLGAVQLNSSCFGDGDVYFRRIPVNPDSHFLQFPTDFNAMLISLHCIEYHQNHVRVFSNCDHLTTSPFTICSTLNDPRQIKQLNFSIVVVDHTWNAGQGRELVCSREGCSVCNAGEECTLSDGGKSNHADSCITETTYFKSFTFASFGCWLKQLRAIACKFSLELSYMVLGGFVLLSSHDFLLYFFDLVCSPHTPVKCNILKVILQQITMKHRLAERKRKERAKTLETLDFSEYDASSSFLPRKSRQSHQKCKNHQTYSALHNHSQSSTIDPNRMTPRKSQKKESSVERKLHTKQDRNKTEYLYEALTYSLPFKQNKTLLQRLRSVSKKIIYPFDNCYRFDGYQILSIHEENAHFREVVVKKLGDHRKKYIFHEAKDEEQRKIILENLKIKKLLKNVKPKDREYLINIINIYEDSKCIASVSSRYGQTLLYHLSQHTPFAERLRSDTQFLHEFIKGILSGLMVIHENGLVHNGVNSEGIHIEYVGRLKDENNRKASNVVGKEYYLKSVKLGNLERVFATNDKRKYLRMERSIWTPPEIINFIKFNQNIAFDRPYLDAVDQLNGYEIDMWSFGVFLLSLLQGKLPTLTSLEEIFQAQEKLSQSVRIVDQGLNLAMKRMLEIEPSQRLKPKQLYDLL